MGGGASAQTKRCFECDVCMKFRKLTDVYPGGPWLCASCWVEHFNGHLQTCQCCNKLYSVDLGGHDEKTSYCPTCTERLGIPAQPCDGCGHFRNVTPQSPQSGHDWRRLCAACWLEADTETILDLPGTANTGDGDDDDNSEWRLYIGVRPRKSPEISFESASQRSPIHIVQLASQANMQEKMPEDSPRPRVLFHSPEQDSRSSARIRPKPSRLESLSPSSGQKISRRRKHAIKWSGVQRFFERSQAVSLLPRSPEPKKASQKQLAVPTKRPSPASWGLMMAGGCIVDNTRWQI